MTRQASNPESVTVIPVPGLEPEVAALIAGNGRAPHSVMGYLARLQSDASRRGQLSALAMALAALGEHSRLGDLPAEVRAAYRAKVWTFDWAAMRNDRMAAVRFWLADLYAPATANKALAAVKGVLRSAWRLGLMDSDTCERTRDVESVRGTRITPGRLLTLAEISALLAACEADPSPHGVRDGAMIALGFGIGARVAEVAALRLADYDGERGTLRIRGKGNKERRAFSDGPLADALTDWLAIRGEATGPLFCQIARWGGEIRPTLALSTFAIQKLLARRAREARIEPISWHALRRAHVSHALAAGIDLTTVSRNVGHAAIQTTARYDVRPEAARREAMARLHVPYRRRRPIKAAA